MNIPYCPSLSSDFFSAFFQDLNKLIPHLLNLLFESRGQVTLSIAKTLR
jgi:hypothetical protein